MSDTREQTVGLAEAGRKTAYSDGRFSQILQNQIEINSMLSDLRSMAAAKLDDIAGPISESDSTEQEATNPCSWLGEVLSQQSDTFDMLNGTMNRLKDL